MKGPCAKNTPKPSLRLRVVSRFFQATVNEDSHDADDDNMAKSR